MAKNSTGNLFDKAFADLLEANVSEKHESEYNPNLYSESFDDEGECWGDINSNVLYQNPDPVPAIVPKVKPREVAMHPPKDSLLVKKYFSDKTEKKPVPKPQIKPQEDSLKEIKIKIEELNEEIKNVKKEGDEFKRLTILCDEKKRLIAKEQEELERFEELINNEIEEVNEKELEKFKREAKVHERNQKLLQNLPNKKERDEIEKLRSLMAKVKEEGTMMKNRYKLNRDRVTKQLEDAKSKKEELIQRLEKIDSIASAQGSQSPIPIQVPAFKSIPESQTPKFSIPDLISPANPRPKAEQEIKTNQKSILLPPSETQTIQVKPHMHKSKSTTQDFDLNIFEDTRPNAPAGNSYIQQNVDLLELEVPSGRHNTAPAVKRPSAENIEKDSKNFEPEALKFPDSTEHIPVIDTKTFDDGRIAMLYESGHKEMVYPNGTKKEEYPNGYSVNFYVNSDVKQVFPDGKILYFYAEANTTHACFPNGSEIIRFGNGQVEKHYADGSKKIKYTDGTIKMIRKSGEVETIYPDSTREIVGLLGERVVYHPGGHKEIICNGVIKRVYSNGGSKILRN